jgi:hypothetical protein
MVHAIPFHPRNVGAIPKEQTTISTQEKLISKPVSFRSAFFDEKGKTINPWQFR